MEPIKEAPQRVGGSTGMILRGELIRHCGMWTEKIYQDGEQFILESQSEMMPEPRRDVFASFDAAYRELCRRT